MKKLSYRTFALAITVPSVLQLTLSCNTTSSKRKNWGSYNFIKTYDVYSTDLKLENVKKVSDLNRSKVDNTNVMYQITLYSFSDGDGDGIGDLIGAKNRLPYLKKLGIDQVWLSPIHPASSYHGYDVIDYMDVAPELGGMEAFDEFLRESHNLGIKVYLDNVYNHTSFEHPWFQEALKGTSPFTNYYHIKDVKLSGEYHTDSTEARQMFRNIQDKTGTQKTYLGKFWSGMPDLNLDNPAVIDELKKINAFWSIKGVDGFRFDAYDEFFSSVGETQITTNKQRIIADLREASNEAKKKHNFKFWEDSFFFGEGWKGMDTENDFTDDNNRRAFDSIYDSSHFKNNLMLNVSVDQVKSNLLAYKMKNNNAKWLPFLSNHDEVRFMAKYREKISKVSLERVQDPLTNYETNANKIAIATMLMLPSTPIIYQGDELGYYANKMYGDPGLREPIRWTNEPLINFTQDNSPDNNKVFLNFSKTRNFADVQLDSREEADVAWFVKDIISIRSNYDFIGQTNDKTIDSLNSGDFFETNGEIQGFIRKNETDQETFIILYNMSPGYQKEIALSQPLPSNYSIMVNLNSSISSDKITLLPTSLLILKLN